jgi:hypothetical protein
MASPLGRCPAKAFVTVTKIGLTTATIPVTRIRLFLSLSFGKRDPSVIGRSRATGQREDSTGHTCQRFRLYSFLLLYECLC